MRVKNRNKNNRKTLSYLIFVTFIFIKKDIKSFRMIRNLALAAPEIIGNGIIGGLVGLFGIFLAYKTNVFYWENIR